jgi:allantoinase
MRGVYEIRSTRVVLPSGMQPATIRIENGRIAAVSTIDPGTPEPRASNLEHRSYGDLVILPGLVDSHVHVNEPGRTEWEGFETATRAAAAGGVTSLVDMPLNSIPATTTVAALEEKRASARGHAHVDVGFWGGVVPGNAGELDALCDAGVLGFKCFLVPSGVDEFPAVDERDLRQAMPILARHGVPLLVHAEAPSALRAIAVDAATSRYTTWLDSRPSRAEVEAIEMMVGLCREFDTHVHIVHVAAAEALPVLARARAEGLPVTAETCPHYLTFCAGEIADGSTVHKCAPPIRDARVRDALWKALEAGVLDLIASDHSPCPPSSKPPGDFLRAWGGIASLELSLAVVWTGAARRHLPISRVADWMCSAPATLAGLAPRKGRIAEGADADLVVFDPDARLVVDAARLHQRHPLTPYAGMTLQGVVRETYVRGELVYREGEGHGASRIGELLAV